MDKPIPNWHFRFMSFVFRIRDLLLPRENLLEEAGIKPGFHVLDYGCGPGSYSLVAAKMVGNSGTVHALDIHPLAVEQVKRRASKEGLANIKTILSGRDTGLPDKSMDIILLYDIVHNLGDPDSVLAELQRVLKPGGVLSFSDHHMKDEDIIARMTGAGLFTLSTKGKKTYSFVKSR